MIEGGLYSVTALRETWAGRRCILNTRIYHKQASTTRVSEREREIDRKRERERERERERKRGGG